VRLQGYDPEKEYIGRCIGPRVEGGTYWCGYWETTYEVLSIHRGPSVEPPRRLWTITVRWEDGRVVTHSMPWADEGPARSRDRVVA